MESKYKYVKPDPTRLAEKTVDNFIEKARRIHERELAGKEELSDYVKRWQRWANSGLSLAPNEQKNPPKSF